MFCEKCGEQLKDDALFCQNCGAKVERKTPKKMVRRYYILFAIAIVCAISIIIVNNVFFKSNNEEDFVGEDEITSVETNPVFTETESVTEEKNEQIKTKETYRNFMVTERYKYEYDQNGNIIAIYADMDGYGLKLASNSEYDYKGNKIKTVCYNNGNPYQWEIYTYDNANLLSQKTYDIDNQLVDEYTYSYDDKNRLIEKKHSYQDYTSYVIRYVYDNLGNQIEETTNYNENPLGDFTRCQYDEHGNIVKKENGRGEKINNYSEYSYNVKGQLIESRYYLGDELSLSSIATYDYDLNGNVIRENIDNFTRTKSTSNSEYVTKKKHLYRSTSTMKIIIKLLRIFIKICSLVHHVNISMMKKVILLWNVVMTNQGIL